jgi:hypothetical protein
VSDVSFDVSEKRLEHSVLLINDFGIVKDVLHGFVVCLLGVHSQFLKFGLVFTKVENGLGKDNISINLVMQVSKSRPVSNSFNLKSIKHNLTIHFLSGTLDVLLSHLLHQAVFSLL